MQSRASTVGAWLALGTLTLAVAAYTSSSNARPPKSDRHRLEYRASAAARLAPFRWAPSSLLVWRSQPYHVLFRTNLAWDKHSSRQRTAVSSSRRWLRSPWPKVPNTATRVEQCTPMDYQQRLAANGRAQARIGRPTTCRKYPIPITRYKVRTGRGHALPIATSVHERPIRSSCRSLNHICAFRYFLQRLLLAEWWAFPVVGY